jgi:hypothetical protein
VSPRIASLLLAVACAAAAALAACSGRSSEADAGACQVEPTETFHDRIEPLLVDGKVSTCNQCHLAGVDLSVFARQTPCETWACLREQGLVDVADPENSKVLSWIERASPDSDLITPEVIDAERDAFRAWIEANAACPGACAGVSCGAPDEGPICAVTDHGPPDAAEPAAAPGCSDREVEQAFYDDVYAWRGRCFPCHFDTETKADARAPRFLSAVGNCQTGSAVSLKRIVELGMIDSSDPAQSLLLQKPLDLPENRHGGGAKFTRKDRAYQSFLRFIELYRSCTQDRESQP